VGRHTLVAAATVLTALVSAGRSRAADAVVGADLASAHVWRGITFNRGPVIQPHMTVSGLELAGRPVILRVFANYDVGNDDPEVATSNLSEIDLEARLDIGGGLSFAYAELTYPGQTPRRGFDATRELTLAWRVSGPIDGSAAVHYDAGEIDDYFLEAALGRGFAVSDKSRLALRALAGYAGRSFAIRYGGGRGGYYQFDLSMRIDYQPTEHLSLTATVAYAGTFHQALPKQLVGFYGGVGATVRY
jgi:hypothetical protein